MLGREMLRGSHIGDLQVLGPAEELEEDAGSTAQISTSEADAVPNPPSLPWVKTSAGIKPGSPGSLTNVILQADLQLGPQHDESKGGVEVDIIGVVHPVLLAWKERGDGEGWETCRREGKGGARPPSHMAQEVGLFHGTGRGSHQKWFLFST